MRRALSALVALLLAAAGVAAPAAAPRRPGPPPENGGLTAVAGLKVGDYTLTARPTGCTVILAEAGAVAGVDQRGGAPGTRELGLLNPINTVQKVNAIVLAGGSAFGLDAASGTMRWLDEHHFGYNVGITRVPIVPAAILFDLNIGGKPWIRPTADCGYRAAAAATTGPVQEGDIGAGAGATVGKLGGPGRAMKAGLGSAAITLPDGLTVAAIVAVNAVGDIIDPSTGRVVAGMRTPDGLHLADARKLILSGALMHPRTRSGENTTIGVVATNAKLTKDEVTKMTQMASDGYARAISPVHTPVDGDTVFGLATGTHAGDANVLEIGALAADAMARAIVRAAYEATSIPGYPAERDLGKVK
ncbi:MAG TPA: P1 family peptidase [Vicinamibacterales bacterium]|nr:P1 family peptidase [Vicinamibacterales bacterium]